MVNNVLYIAHRDNQYHMAKVHSLAELLIRYLEVWVIGLRGGIKNTKQSYGENLFDMWEKARYAIYKAEANAVIRLGFPN